MHGDWELLSAPSSCTAGEAALDEVGRLCNEISELRQTVANEMMAKQRLETELRLARQRETQKSLSMGEEIARLSARLQEAEHAAGERLELMQDEITLLKTAEAVRVAQAAEAAQASAALREHRRQRRQQQPPEAQHQHPAEAAAVFLPQNLPRPYSTRRAVVRRCHADPINCHGSKLQARKGQRASILPPNDPFSGICDFL